MTLPRCPTHTHVATVERVVDGRSCISLVSNDPYVYKLLEVTPETLLGTLIFLYF